ncbi:MAG: hypothetical protein DRQ55_11580 [Planctomycetota bacterium]|nr:MAG: hypothetical protein DRQ55_11580 [Planctomycetota bacterium]
MQMLSITRRVALLLALLPQLVVLGLGHGVVICMTADGHMEVEVASSGCCAESPVVAMAAGTAGLIGPAGSAQQSDADCGSCSDFGIVLDPRPCRGSGVGTSLLSSDLANAPPSPSVALDDAVDSAACAVAHGSRGGVTPLHLEHLRSIQLSC